MVFTAIAVGLMVGGMVLQAYGQHKAGQAAKAAAEAGGLAAQKGAEAAARSSESEAGLSDDNAGVAALQAKDAIERGVEQEGRFRAQVRGAIGTQRAGFAASNVDVGFGSPADVQGDAAYLGELDALTIRNNARREAWGYEVQSFDMRTRAQIDRDTAAAQREAGATDAETGRIQGAAAATTANWQALGTIATGSSSLLMTRYGFGKK